MKKIGLTGNIGSGKTTIASVFELLGIAVFNADREAKRLMHENKDLKTQLLSTFGDDLYIDGHLNRQFLAQLAFTDDNVLKRLNTLVHPIVQIAFEEWCDKQVGPYIIKEAAILFESNSYQSMDSIICVSCPESIRINRLLTRDNTTEQQIKDRMNKQWDEKKKINLSNHHIINDDKTLVIPQVLAIHDLLKNTL